jgi:hypothetical protein
MSTFIPILIGFVSDGSARLDLRRTETRIGVSSSAQNHAGTSISLVVSLRIVSQSAAATERLKVRMTNGSKTSGHDCADRGAERVSRKATTNSEAERISDLHQSIVRNEKLDLKARLYAIVGAEAAQGLATRD